MSYYATYCDYVFDEDSDPDGPGAKMTSDEPFNHSGDWYHQPSMTYESENGFDDPAP
jgi:hypothetical protein